MALENISSSSLFSLLAVLFFLSAFFSGTETALMRVNRYQLSNKAKQNHRAAQQVLRLLRTPDRLIGLILLGNNFVNILIAQLASYLGFRLYGELGIAIATGLLIFFLLVFAELAPKTLGAIHSQKVSLYSAWIYRGLLFVLYPLVALINAIANGLLRLMGLNKADETITPLNRDELHTLLHGSGHKISEEYLNMLLGILDLESKTVEDIMVPRNEIVGINIDQNPNKIINRLSNAIYTRIPIYRDNDIDTCLGILHTRKILSLITQQDFDLKNLAEHARKTHFMPENMNLLRALLDFKANKRRTALVVDEYGNVKGLVTLDDLFEEIVGDFTRDPATYDSKVDKQADGSAIVDGTCHVRELNHAMNWRLDEHGPKTVNGLMLEKLESIGEAGTSVMIGGHPFEVLMSHGNVIRKVRVKPSANVQAGATQAPSGTKTPS